MRVSALHKVVSLFALLTLVLGAQALADNHTDTEMMDPTMTEPVSETPTEAMGLLQEFMIAGVDTGPTPQLTALFRNLRLTIEATDNETLEVVGLAVSPVEEALLADPFDLNDLTSALDSLALEMRTVADAGPDEADLLVELASLMDQTSAYITETAFEPRMEVEQP